MDYEVQSSSGSEEWEEEEEEEEGLEEERKRQQALMEKEKVHANTILVYSSFLSTWLCVVQSGQCVV